jgi:hypothetical protein
MDFLGYHGSDIHQVPVLFAFVIALSYPFNSENELEILTMLISIK